VFEVVINNNNYNNKLLLYPIITIYILPQILMH